MLKRRNFYYVFKKLNVGTVPTFKKLNVGTVPTFKNLNVGTVPTFNLQKRKIFVKKTVRNSEANMESFYHFNVY